MSSAALLVLAVAIVPAFGAAVWVWLANAREIDALQSFAGFEGMHFED